MKKNEVVVSGYELYKKMLESGFEAGRGRAAARDTCLYNQLKNVLCCPNGKGLLKHLKDKQTTAVDFLSAFLQISEPFSAMYNDIYETMKTYHVSKSKKAIKIKLGDGDKPFGEIDLSHFEEHMMRYAKVQIATEVRHWRSDDYYKLGHFFYAFKGRYFHKNNYPVILRPPVHGGDNEILVILDNIYQLFSDTEKSIKAYRDSKLSYYNYDRLIKELYGDDFEPDFFLALVNDYNRLIENIGAVLADPGVKNAICIYRDIIKNLESSTVHKEVTGKMFERVLNLPFWEKRWYIYEVWVTCLTVQPLKKFNPDLNIKDDNVLQLSSMSASAVAEFKSFSGETYAVAAQVRTPAKASERKSIIPDIRIAKVDYRERKNTCLIVECKQRKNMAKSDLSKNIEIYEMEAPNSVKNIFVNYDVFPDLELKPSKTELFSSFQPCNSLAVDTYKCLIAECLERLK